MICLVTTPTFTGVKPRPFFSSSPPLIFTTSHLHDFIIHHYLSHLTSQISYLTSKSTISRDTFTLLAHNINSPQADLCNSLLIGHFLLYQPD
jgi:hypothetical protein